MYYFVVFSLNFSILSYFLSEQGMVYPLDDAHESCIVNFPLPGATNDTYQIANRIILNFKQTHYPNYITIFCCEIHMDGMSIL